MLWWLREVARTPPIAQLAEAADLKSAKSGFESQWGDKKREIRVDFLKFSSTYASRNPAFIRRFHRHAWCISHVSRIGQHRLKH